MKFFFVGVAVSVIGALYAPPRYTNPYVVIAQQRFKEREQREQAQGESQSLRTRSRDLEGEDFESYAQQAYYRRYERSRQTHGTWSSLGCLSDMCLFSFFCRGVS